MKFLENISAKFTKTFAEKFPEEVRQNIEQKVSDSAPYILAGAVGAVGMYFLLNRRLPFKRCVTSFTIINNYYK